MKIPERFIGKLKHFATKTMMNRSPDFIVGGKETPYMLRWWIIPRNKLFNIYLHKFMRSDDDRALHDHPWINASILVSGQYVEHTPRGKHLRREGFMYFRRARALHRVELFGDKSMKPISCTTIFITGPVIREWGFACPQGWRHWKDFTAADDKGAVGKGCE